MSIADGVIEQTAQPADVFVDGVNAQSLRQRGHGQDLLSRLSLVCLVLVHVWWKLHQRGLVFGHQLPCNCADLDVSIVHARASEWAPYLFNYTIVKADLINPPPEFFS